MRNFKSGVALLIIVSVSLIVLIVKTAEAEQYGGVEFPDGEVSFADAVISFNPSNGVSAPYNDPANALGAPNYAPGGNHVALGDEGIIVLQFTDNSLTTSGDSSEDLWVFEVGNEIEPASVAISINGINWIEVGETSGATSGVDIDAYIDSGVVVGERYSFVKITDLLPHQSSSPYEGADIDAIGAISSAPPAFTCEDSDGDGVADYLDNCPNTPENSWVNNVGCPASGLYTQEQVDAIIAAILLWGDIDNDKKIGLSEAVHALQITSGITEPAIK